MPDDFYEIRDARVALFETGGMRLVTDKNRGYMVPSNDEAVLRTNLYNDLAAVHREGAKIPAELRVRLKALGYA